MTSLEKFKAIILNLFSKYIVWLIIIGVVIMWWFFPDLTETLGKILIFWGPVIILIFALILTLTKHKFRFKKDKEQGITQYEIIVTGFEFYLIDTVIYLGTIFILIIGFISAKGINVYDLLQALIFFFLANVLKNIFHNKIRK